MLFYREKNQVSIAGELLLIHIMTALLSSDFLIKKLKLVFVILQGAEGNLS